MDEVIFFSHSNAEGVQIVHNHTIIVSLTIANYNVKRILVDKESSVGVLFYEAFCRTYLPTD